MAKIMVVEDDEHLNEVLCYNLTRAGYQVTSVHDGEEAIERLGEEVPDLLLLDVMLPGKNGWEICQHIADRPEMLSLPVVIFTAKSAREDFDTARAFPNFAGYFVKPYATPDVMRHVEKILNE